MRILADENLTHKILNGLRRLAPTLDLVTAQEVGLSGQSDDLLLAWADTNRRVVLSHDVRTLRHAAEVRIVSGSRRFGLLLVPSTAPLRQVIQDLLLADACSHDESLVNEIVYLPL